MEESKIIELKLQNLFLVRTFISQVLIVLTGGVVGLFFMEPSTSRTVFIVLGLLLDLLFAKGYVYINTSIKKNLYKKRSKK